MIEITDKMLATMRATFDPSRYYGFLSGMAFAHLCRDLEQETGSPRDGQLLRFATLRDQFVEEQRAAGEPDGRPRPALFWADLYPVPCEDEEEVIACVELGCVFMLCSTVEPHVQWIVRLGGGEDDDDVIERFDAKAKADRWLENRLQEGKQQREEATKLAVAACRRGDTVKAAEIASEYGLSWSHMAPDSFITIDGIRAEIGGEIVDSGKKPRWTPGDGT